MSFKTLHSFVVTVKQTVPETTTRVENGQTVTVTSNVERDVQHTIVLKEPSRREKQDLSLFQQVKYNEAVNMGLLPRVVMQQKIGRDASNPLSEDEDKNLAAMNSRLQELSNDYIRLNANRAVETDEQKERKQRLLLEYTVLHKKVEDINTAYQSVYAHTAENYMQTKTLSWLTLLLTFKLGAAGMSKPEPFFAGADFTAKEEHAADLEDSHDALYEAVLAKLPTYWMLYLFGRANKPEDFARIEEEWEKQVELTRKAEEEAKKEEEARTVVAPEVLAAKAAAPVVETTVAANPEPSAPATQ